MQNFKDIFYLGHSYIVTTQKKLNIFDLIVKLHDKQQNVDFIKKTNTYLIFLPEFSTKGVELTEANNNYKIQMSFLANVYDFKLCNYIAHLLCKKYNGTLTDEDGNRRRIGKLFNEKKMLEYINKDLEVVFEMLKKGKDIEIIGPVRPFNIGKRTREKMLSIENEKNSYYKSLLMEKFMLNCQYPPSLFKPFHDIVGNSTGNKKASFAQILSNKLDMVIEKTEKYYISGPLGNISIELTKEDLFTILPEEWELIDEYTILAKRLTEENWLNFVSEANQIGKIPE
jgi:hypothetical protein